MSDLAHDREVKIKRYKSKKALEERLEKLASYVDQPHVDEETKVYNFYISIVNTTNYFFFASCICRTNS